jgi:hypothetical protein
MLPQVAEFAPLVVLAYFFDKKKLVRHYHRPLFVVCGSDVLDVDAICRHSPDIVVCCHIFHR